MHQQLQPLIIQDDCVHRRTKNITNNAVQKGVFPNLKGLIFDKLNERKPDLVLVQMGVHWHGIEKYTKDNEELLVALGKYSASNSDALVLFLESLPQHFDALDGSGSHDD